MASDVDTGAEYRAGALPATPMRSGRRDADIPGMLRPGGPGMPERGEFRDGEGAAAARRNFEKGRSRNLRPKSQKDRAALTAGAASE